MTEQQTVLSWLKDAHSMETGGLPTLQDHAETAKDYAEMQAKLSQHASATRRHAELIEGCIKRLGGRPAALKEAVGTAVGKVTGLANLPAKDTVVKNALGDHAAENFEIACYTSLIAAAEQVGDHETADVCKQILRDEEEMADWLKGYIPMLTQTFLTEGTGDEASNGPLGEVSQKVAGLGKKTQEAAANVDSKNALLAGGALLAGAGAALLVGQALRGGKEQTKQDDAVYNAAQPDDLPLTPTEEVYDGSFVTEVPTEQAPMEVVEIEAVEIESVGELGTALPEMGVADLLLDEPDIGVDSTDIWLTPGPYSGLGPVYDDAGDPTGQEVASRLTQHGQVDATNIEITIDGGEVLLEGTVADEEAKQLAQEALESVAGVSRVQNELQVQADRSGSEQSEP